jgi:tetratricopeptide (TPR) repeat protein
MYDLVELERQWTQYDLERKKKQFVIIVLSFGMLCCLFALAYFIFHQTTKDMATPSHNTTKIVQDSQVDTIEKKKTIDVISLSLPIIANDEIKNPPLNNEIILQTSTDISAINILQKRYNEKKDYTNAIELAKAYLANNQYASAKRYAIEANEIEPTKEDGWIVFAKASAALGAKSDAIKALEKYNQVNNNNKTKELEEELKNQ